jgi:hypothetical protein
MKIAASTTFSIKGYNEYAHRVVDTFIKYWPSNIDLYAYYDEIPQGGWKLTAPNVHYIKLDFPELLEFKKQNYNNPKQSGNGTNKDFLRDAIRFSHKVFAYIDLALNRNADIAIWLDGDVITHQPINENVVLSWLNGKMSGALLRPFSYTETGFHIFDMRHPQSKTFMNLWKQQYTENLVWNLPWNEEAKTKLGYTDCHTYDAVRQKFDQNLWFDLSPSGLQHPHPFVNGPLGAYMDHTKGPRKAEGRSRKSDIHASINRNESYWNS